MSTHSTKVWSEEDIERAISEIKSVPGLWNQLEEMEKTTADFRGTELQRAEFSILGKLFPDHSLSLNEMTDLYAAVRKYRRAELGLR